MSDIPATARTDFNGRTTTYQYDAINRLTRKTPAAVFAAPAVVFTYSATGQRLTMSDASGSTTYTYDTRDRLLSKATPQGTLAYTYGAAGNLRTVASSNANGASATYSYDLLNRLGTVTDQRLVAQGATSATTTYAYDAVGNLAGYTYPNGVETSYTYNSLNWLTSMASTCSTAALGCAPGATLASYAYTLGAAGNRTSVAELSGRTLNYGYDNLYRLTSETIAGAASQNGAISYVYDAVGNRQTMASTVPAIPAGMFFYDANDRLTTDAYDANGNTTSSGGIENSYDFENRLVQRGAITIVYDGDGNRVSKTAGGVTTKYLVDTNNLTGYAQVLDELQGGAVTRTYTYGLELISKLETGNSQLSFYGYDGHGSVRQLTNSSGAITDTYNYDAFGNLIESTGSTPNLYLYAGEQFDPDLGLYYNRARYLDVRTGRFWGMDEFEGDAQSPVSLHRYLYANLDPVGFDFALPVASMVAVASLASTHREL